MNKFIQKLFKTLGVKRKVAAFLAALSPVIASRPELAFILPYLDLIAGTVGLVGVTHATIAGGAKVPAATVSGVFSTLLLLTYLVPALAEYQDLVRMLAAAFGVSLVLKSKSLPEARVDSGGSAKGPQ